MCHEIFAGPNFREFRGLVLSINENLIPRKRTPAKKTSAKIYSMYLGY